MARNPKNLNLCYHKGTGQRYKKIRGVRHYFGTDKAAAEQRWLEVASTLLTGKG